MKIAPNQIAKTGKKGFFFIRCQRPKSCLVGTLLLLFLVAGCAASHQNYRNSGNPSTNSSGDIREAYLRKISALRDDLIELNGQTDLTEASRVAETAITYADDLVAEYNLVRPAEFHNVLVRIGLKDRGLCYHWTEDLMKRLQSLELDTFQLHWGVAYRGSELREHNSVVITARGQEFENGMVLDPWRHSGDLYWTLIEKDTYPWEELPPEEW
jgi:hypothetical protein